MHLGNRRHCVHLGNLGNRRHLGNRKSMLCYVIIYILCSLQWKKKTAGKDVKPGKLVAVRKRGLDGKIQITGAHAISQSDSRI